MSDDLCEEQEMEAEALAAIFDDCLEIISAEQPFEWAVSLWPEQHAADEDDDDAPQNFVGIKVIAKIPLTYPEESLPNLSIKVLKGLTEEHEEELLDLAMEEAENNRGMPVMYTVCERLREWLLENNQKGMDDRSMYTQMLKREKEKPCSAGISGRRIFIEFVVPVSKRFIDHRKCACAENNVHEGWYDMRCR